MLEHEIKDLLSAKEVEHKSKSSASSSTKGVKTNKKKKISEVKKDKNK